MKIMTIDEVCKVTTLMPILLLPKGVEAKKKKVFGNNSLILMKTIHAS